MARAIKITSVSGALTVTITGPNGGTPVVYADSQLVNTLTMPATVADAATTSFWLPGPGKYTLSVKTSGGTEIAADNNQTRTVDLETDGSVAALNYDARTLAMVSGDSGHSTAGGSAASLPPDAPGYLHNDGAGNKAWNAGTQIGSSTPAAPTAAGAPGTSGQASDAGHAHPSLGILSLFWGDGSDGSVTLDGSSAVNGCSRSGTVYTTSRPVSWVNCTINAGATLVTTHPVAVSGTLTNGGTIQMDGLAAAGATAGGQVQINSYFSRSGAGGNGATGNGVAGNAPNTNGGGGAGGAAGAGGTGTAGGAGNPANPAGGSGPGFGVSPHNFITTWTGIVSTGGGNVGWNSGSGGGGGGGGGGDGTNSGGGGGGGAGVLHVRAFAVVNNGAIHANGGAGANGLAGNSGGGGGGGGGVVYVNSTSYTGSAPVAAGGAPGTGTGTGANGTVGAVGYVQQVTWA